MADRRSGIRAAQRYKKFAQFFIHVSSAHLFSAVAIRDRIYFRAHSDEDIEQTARVVGEALQALILRPVRHGLGKPAVSVSPAEPIRAVAKFFFEGERKFFVKGVTYGPFKQIR